jgi:hypothetical protein
LWIGLSAGLISVACVLAVAWTRRVEWLRRELRSAETGDQRLRAKTGTSLI